MNSNILSLLLLFFLFSCSNQVRLARGDKPKHVNSKYLKKYIKNHKTPTTQYMLDIKKSYYK